MSNNISFCASHISPCEPKNASAVAPPKLTAYIVSIISYSAAQKPRSAIPKNIANHFFVIHFFKYTNSAAGYAKTPTRKCPSLSKLLRPSGNRKSPGRDVSRLLKKSNGTFSKVKCPPIVWYIKKTAISKYEKFEKRNLLKLNISKATVIITGIFSAHQSIRSRGAKDK